MAEATAEAHTAPVADSKPEVNGAEKSNGGNEQVSNGGEAKKVHDEDNPERYDSRDKRDSRRDNDRRGGRDGGRDGGRGRGRGRGNGRGRGRGGGRFGNRGGNDYHKKDGVRTDFDRKDESSDQAEIRRQVEFYFSESNLPIDKYLLEETGGSENKPFPLKTLHNFKRMRHFQPFSAVVEAVKGSAVLEVNDKDEVFRKEPLDSRFTNDVRKNAELLTSVTMGRSIYAKGFGEETRTTVFDIEEFVQPIPRSASANVIVGSSPPTALVACVSVAKMMAHSRDPSLSSSSTQIPPSSSSTWRTSPSSTTRRSRS